MWPHPVYAMRRTTFEHIFLSRRKFLQAAGLLAANVALLAACGRQPEMPEDAAETTPTVTPETPVMSLWSQVMNKKIEDGYELWLRYRKVDDAERLSTVRRWAV
jgi:hypothetical protein